MSEYVAYQFHVPSQDVVSWVPVPRDLTGYARTLDEVKPLLIQAYQARCERDGIEDRSAEGEYTLLDHLPEALQASYGSEPA